MIRSTGPFAALEHAAVEWDRAGRPRSARFDDGYFGNEDAVAESRHVFLDGSELTARLREDHGEPFVVGELGFGTGLNFLLTWRAVDAGPSRRRRLHYLSIDRHPLRRVELERALAAFPDYRREGRALAEALPPPVAGLHRRLFDGGRVVLDLYWAEAAEALAELAQSETACVDAWYLDGFAPSRNPGMWREDLFTDLARASRDGATVASYSAAGAVRRGLEGAGFSITRRPGFGSKRECIHGRLSVRPRQAAPTVTPWDLPQTFSSTGARRSGTAPIAGERRALVIGAGLAGAHAAAALARRDWAVTVLAAGSIADRASGNPQGVLFTRLSHRRSILADFSLAAFLFASDFYRQLFRTGALREGVEGSLSGCLQTAPPRGDFAALCEVLGDLAGVATVCDATAASARLGAVVDEAALWQPGSGWLAPPAVCRALLASPGIETQTKLGDLTLEHRADGAWHALDATGRSVCNAPVAIVAAGADSVRLSQLAGLPLKSARGQTTQIPAPRDQPLRAALSHRGYIAPAVGDEHCIGATFSADDRDRALRREDHRANLEALATALPAWREHLEKLDPGKLVGRAEVRCVSPDYLPLVGPVHDVPLFMERFGALGSDASAIVDARGAYLANLYLSTAHGSRGLSYAALGAEVLASQICGESPALPRQVLRALAPARFTIRAIVRGTS